MLKDKIYALSPIGLKTILLNIKAYLNTKERFTKDYYAFLYEYIELWESDIDTIKAFQEQKLIDLLLECLKFSQYYKKIMQGLEISETEIRNAPYETLLKLPLLSKEIRKNRVNEIINKNPERSLFEVGYTSGTSGSPTEIYIDKESAARSFALWSRFHHFIGLKWKDRSVRFSGRLIVNPTQNKKPFWIYNKIENQLFMSSYHLKEENLPAYISKLNSFKPKLIDGYPSAVYILSKYINSNEIKLDFTPIAIALTAETLYDYQREEIEKAFGTKVFNQYASSEGSPFITECMDGRLHINLDSGVFEFLNSQNEEAKPGETARLVVTSFRNYKTPLLRYDILDTVQLQSENKDCACGCKMPYVEKLTGREDDLLWTEEKGYVGRMDTAYKGLSGIVQSQIIQIDKNTIVVNQIIDSNYNPKMNELFIQNLKDRLGQSIQITINIVNEIPHGANGKFEAVKRKFKVTIRE